MNAQTPKVAVIGAGVAGAAAAWAVRRAGMRVDVIHGTAGASALYSGAVDRVPWERTGSAEPLPGATLEFTRALGIWRIGPALARIATRAGIVRPARAADRALLDLAPLAGHRIAVADVDRDDWDAALLASSLASSDWARTTKTEFVPVRISAIRSGHERRIAAVDFARLLDDPDRLAWFAEQLRNARAPEREAWLTGPWLGLERDVAAELRAELGVVVGETTSAPGGVAGARYEWARDRLFEREQIDVRFARAVRIELANAGVHIETPSETIDADAVIIATGGLVGGGISAAPARMRGAALSFVPSVEVPGADLAIGGRAGISARFDGVQSLDPSDDLRLLETVGMRTDGPRVPGTVRVFAAGDLRHGLARTLLAALESGLESATAAVRELGR